MPYIIAQNAKCSKANKWRASQIPERTRQIMTGTFLNFMIDSSLISLLPKYHKMAKTTAKSIK